MSALRRIVVVGNGIAGLTAADTLRAEGFDGDLTIIGDEPHPAYSRPALSKALLHDRDDLTSHQLPEAAHGAEQLLGVRVSGLDPSRRVVEVDGHGAVPYDGLVIATGCRARRLGGPDSGELTLRTLDDALALRGRIGPDVSVVVVGGGPLGMEIASACLAAGCAVTLVAGEQPLLAQLGADLSQRFVAAAERQGLRIVMAAAVDVRRRAGRRDVHLADGRHLSADVVVTSIGDVPNVQWLGDLAPAGGKALEVDTRGRLTAGVVAAGDVAAVPGPGGVRRRPLWNSAIAQAKTAATGLVRGDDAPELDHQPYFWTDQFGLSLKVVGHLPCAGSPTPLEGPSGEDAALLRWEGTAVAAINHRIPIPRLRRLLAAA